MSAYFRRELTKARDEVNRLRKIVDEQDSELAEVTTDRDTAYRKLAAIEQAIKR